MDGAAVVPADDSGPIFENPLPALLTGLGFMVAAVLGGMVAGGPWVAIPLLIGSIATGIGLAIKPKEWWVLVAGCFNFLTGGTAVAFARADESGLYLFAFAAAAALIAFKVSLMPRVVQKVVVSLFIIFHFGGICTAVLAAPPQPWVFEWLWVHVYRPYLQFTYLNNAYHFYAPEPGPASLVWYCVEYEPDPVTGARPIRWVRVPNIEDGKVVDRDEYDRARSIPRVQFTRRLSLAMSAGQNIQVAPVVLKNLSDARALRGNVDGIPMYPTNILPVERQYREPNSLAKRWIASYARHVAQTYKHPDFPDRKVTGVKVYMIEHLYPSPGEIGTTHDQMGKPLAPRRLDDPAHYLPVYLGEFDTEGKMKPSCFAIEVDGQGNTNKWNVKQRDPYLYWVIPILYHGVTTGETRQILYRDTAVDNFMLKHAGDPNWENIEWWKQDEGESPK